MHPNRFFLPALLLVVLLLGGLVDSAAAQPAAGVNPALGQPGPQIGVAPQQPAAPIGIAPQQPGPQIGVAPQQPAAGMPGAAAQPGAGMPGAALQPGAGVERPPAKPPVQVDVKVALQPGMIHWAGTPIQSLDVFRDKTVVVLVYATWCPKCNTWSGELFKQLKETVATRPVVILAINTDESPRGVQEYLTQRGFFAPNIFHGYDPLLPKRLGLQSNLFQAALISPDGRATGMQYAGVFSGGAEGKQFALARILSQSSDLGEFRFISADMSAEAAQLLWPLELGPVSEMTLRRVRARLSEEDKTRLDAAIEKFLDARLAEIRELYYGELADKLRAYDLSVELAKMFRNREQCATARRVVAALEAQPGFNRELQAKRSYEKMAETAQSRPDQRASLLFRVARAYEGTYYGDLAREEAQSAQNTPRPGGLP